MNEHLIAKMRTGLKALSMVRDPAPLVVPLALMDAMQADPEWCEYAEKHCKIVGFDLGRRDSVGVSVSMVRHEDGRMTIDRIDPIDFYAKPEES